MISGLFLYTSIDPGVRQRQSLTRRSNQSVPTVVDIARLEVSPDEMKAAIVLFYSLLDEQQRRLYAGLESMHPNRARSLGAPRPKTVPNRHLTRSRARPPSLHQTTFDPARLELYDCSNVNLLLREP